MIMDMSQNAVKDDTSEKVGYLAEPAVCLHTISLARPPFAIPGCVLFVVVVA